jgi:4-diphosphocytidyl-2-C-methyl-D-erythritol kinase
MIVFPNAKINLGLRIVSKRNDGYHNLNTVFYPLPFYDILELVRSDNYQQEVFFTTSGKEISGDTSSNLCIKAYYLLKQSFPEIPSIMLHLHKNIPMGAGLGGGSADGAFMIKLLNEKFQLNLDDEKMKNYALQLGSDCPFFIGNKPAHATGRGEVLNEISCDLSSKSFLLINPGIHVSTAEAFSKITISENAQSCSEIINQPIEKWPSILVNDFEKTVFSHHPSIEKIKNRLYDAGAIYASMTGSGSTVFGIFANPIQENLFTDSGYEVISISNGKASRL